jgi:hypothetical protein
LDGFCVLVVRPTATTDATPVEQVEDGEERWAEDQQATNNRPVELIVQPLQNSVVFITFLENNIFNKKVRTMFR